MSEHESHDRRPVGAHRAAGRAEAAATAVSDHLKELARHEAEIRGDPLTPEEEARIRAQERRKATEMRIRHESGRGPKAFLTGHDGCFPPSWLFSLFSFSSLASSLVSCSRTHVDDRSHAEAHCGLRAPPQAAACESALKWDLWA